MAVIKDICFAVSGDTVSDSYFLDLYTPRDYDITKREHETIQRGTFGTSEYDRTVGESEIPGSLDSSVNTDHNSCDLSKYDAIQGNDSLDNELNSYFERNSTSGSDVTSTLDDEVNIRSASPFIVFIHGGGWRRGGRDAWKHYLYYDVNFLVCICQWLVGTYKNVGEDMSRAGIGCAVISYPLSEAGLGCILLELFLSYMMSCMAVLLISSPLIGLYLSWQYLVFHSTSPWLPYITEQNHVQILQNALLCITLVTNIAILFLFSFKRREYRLKYIHIQLLWFVLSITGLCLHHLVQDRLGIYAVVITLVVTQGVILRRRLSRCGNTYDHQVKVVAQAVRWALQLGRTTGICDPSRIYLMGHSAGGHLATLTVLDQRVLTDVGCSATDIKGVISLSGVYDLPCLDRLPLRPIYLHPTFGSCPKTWRKASPKHLVTNKESLSKRSSPRFLLMSAENDPFLKTQSWNFFEALQEAEIDCRHVEIKGTNHFSIITNLKEQRTGNALSILTHVIQFID